VPELEGGSDFLACKTGCIGCINGLHQRPRGYSESNLVHKQQYMAPSFGLLGDSCCVQRAESCPFMTAVTGSLPESTGFG
jgi:hypothetical protein